MSRPTPWKRFLFYVIGDAFVIYFASLITYAVATRQIWLVNWSDFAVILPYASAGLVCQVLLGLVFSSYRLKWSTFSLPDVPRTIAPAFVTTLILAGLSGLEVFATLTPWSALTWGLLNIGGVIIVRSSKRIHHEYFHRRSGKRTVLVACSDKSYYLLDALRRCRQFDYKIVGYVDADQGNHKTMSRGMPVLGTFDGIEQVIRRHRIEAAFVLQGPNPQSANGNLHQRLHELGLEVRLIPSLEGLIDGQPDSEVSERLAIHSLTNRSPVLVDPSEMRRVFGKKRIMVTGAGGSIGSELCRQLARFDPGSLILFERDDSNLFYIENELRNSHPALELTPFLGDITRESDVERVFALTRPQVVFHAAAYKHVPILEFHPAEAVRTNVLGSHIVARYAAEKGAESFVYISTDKAVNPTNVMGASKRIGEMLVTAMNNRGGCRFLAVRFGNVLDSRGSVSTIFRQAISRRQPITLTDPDMERYLMLTSEAVLLVMQAAAFGQGGEVFVLDMGNPVRIRDLAETMIRHAGLRPNIDIPVLITGRRPGEKLYEELMTDEEGTTATVNRRIYRARITKLPDYRELTESLGRLEVATRTADVEEIRREVMRQVTNYRPDNACLKGRPTASGSAWHDNGKPSSVGRRPASRSKEPMVSVTGTRVRTVPESGETKSAE